MVLTTDQQRVKSLLRETITILCKNGLHFKSEFRIEGLLGITLDNDGVFLVSIKETVQSELKKNELPAEDSPHVDQFNTSASNLSRNHTGSSTRKRPRLVNLVEHMSSNEQNNRNTGRPRPNFNKHSINTFPDSSISRQFDNTERVDNAWIKPMNDASVVDALAPRSKDKESVGNSEINHTESLADQNISKEIELEKVTNQRTRITPRVSNKYSETVTSDSTELASRTDMNSANTDLREASIKQDMSAVNDADIICIKEENCEEAEENVSEDYMSYLCNPTIPSNATEDFMFSSMSGNEFGRSEADMGYGDVGGDWSQTIRAVDSSGQRQRQTRVQPSSHSRLHPKVNKSCKRAEGLHGLVSKVASSDEKNHARKPSFISAPGETGSEKKSESVGVIDTYETASSSQSNWTHSVAAITGSGGAFDDENSSRDNREHGLVAEERSSHEAVTLESCVSDSRINRGMYANQGLIVNHRYLCPFCPRQFSASNNLRGHLAVHTGVKDFKCVLCGQEFAYKHRLKTHLNCCMYAYNLRGNADHGHGSSGNLSQTDSESKLNDTL